MADTVRSLASLQALLADNTAGDISAQDVRDFLVSAYQPAAVNPGGRLTTESGVGVSTSDRTSQSTLYYTPYVHNRIGLYDGTSWTLHTFAERSLSLSGLTSGKNYDVFLYDNSGTLTLELSAAWTNDTTRADALAAQDGVLVKSGAATRRYLGTIRTTGTTTTEDSGTFTGASSNAPKRFVWNAYNQITRLVDTGFVLDSHSYTTGAWREWRSGTNSCRLSWVQGRAAAVSVGFSGEITSGGGYVGVGLDSTSAPANPQAGNANSSLVRCGGIATASLSAGYHQAIVLEYGSPSASFSNYSMSGAILC